jgi:acyl-CoA carboxylase epsilon subunit-like protein
MAAAPMNDGGVIRILRGRASEEDCAAVVVALMALLRGVRSRQAAVPPEARARAAWGRPPRVAYLPPHSWQSPNPRDTERAV